MARKALLVATATYSDAGLAALRAPTGDVAALARVLGDQGIGGFEVRELVDRPTDELRREIETFFGEGRPQDLLLLYVSGHGVLSQSRRFYLATSTTSLDLLRSTAIEDSFVNDVMQGSRARSIVLVLDCCHSGAFGKGLAPKSPLSVDVEHRFEGQGRVTLSASTELEYAFEETDPSGVNELDPAAPGSLFTRSVIEGLGSGDADVDEDGRISVDDLYDYVCRRVRERSVHQTPGMAGDVRGEITIARSHRRTPLPADLARAVASNLAGIREGAVNELAALAAGSGGLALAARDELERLADDDSRRVSAAARAALGRTEPARPPPAEPAPPDEPPPEPPERPPQRGTPRWRWAAIAAVATGLTALVAAGILLDGDGTTPPAKAAAPYVFTAGGSPQVVLGAEKGSEFGSPSIAGVVVVDAMASATPVSGTRAGVPGRPRPDDGFGAAVASGDFDRNGLADLAIGVPGRDGVSVLYGAEGDPRVQWIDSTKLSEPPEIGGFGSALVARDLDRDGYADLVAGAPGSPEDDATELGSIHIFHGGAKGLSSTEATRIWEHGQDDAHFGRRLAAGDVDGDGSVDLVEGAPTTRDEDGHMSYCEGGPGGPTACVDVPERPTSALAVGNIDGDRFADVVQGDDRFAEASGEVRVWLGGERPLKGRPQVINLNTEGLLGDADPGDEFGHDVAVGRTTGDDPWGDIVVAARSDEDGRGTVWMIPGSETGPVPENASPVKRPKLPRGAQFGGALSLLDYDGDRLPELLVGIDRVTDFNDALVAYVSHDDGLDPEATKPTSLGKAAQLREDAPLSIGR